MAGHDPDEDVDAIDERIRRIRRMHGWTDDAPAGAAPETTSHAAREDEVDRPAERPNRVLWLGYVGPGGERKKVAVGKDHFEIGAGEQADLRLLDASISARHARISWSDGEFRVRDMHSKAGTFVNGEVVPLSRALADGDRLRLGALELKVTLERSPDDPEAQREPAEATTFIESTDDAEAIMAAAYGDDDEPAVAADDGGAPELSHWLVRWIDAEGVERAVELGRGETLTMGRSATCDVQIADKSVSSRHCTLAWPDDAAGPVVTDLGSTNGTFVNTHRTSEEVLAPGDRLHLGRVSVRLDPVYWDSTPEPEPEPEPREATDDDAQRPDYHIVFVGDDGALGLVTVGERNGRVEIGAEEGDIVVGHRGLEPAHAALDWADGALVLESTGGALTVNGRGVKRATVGPDDAVMAGKLRLQIVRSTPSAERTGQGPSIEAAVGIWVKLLGALDPDLELLFVDPEDRGARTELCFWGDGMAELDRKEGAHTHRVSGEASPEFMRALASALLRAGFPDTHRGGDGGRARDPAAPELHAYRGANRADVVFERTLVQRSEGYAEARDLLRAAVRGIDR